VELEELEELEEGAVRWTALVGAEDGVLDLVGLGIRLAGLVSVAGASLINVQVPSLCSMTFLPLSDVATSWANVIVAVANSANMSSRIFFIL